jgi:molecular chaperone GrpE
MTHASNMNETDSVAQTIDLLGAVDIVEAFTALRHELKLQVRGGRELQQSLINSLQRIDDRIASQSIAITNALNASANDSASESRKLATCLAEIEESLQRALGTLIQPHAGMASRSESASTSPSHRFDEEVKNSSWIVRKLAKTLIGKARDLIEESTVASKRQNSSLDSTRKGLELLHSRLIRLMQQCEMERVDVLGKPFDPETMHAIDRIEAESVPSGHVAEQIRPAYLWRESVLRFADVRIAI